MAAPVTLSQQYWSAKINNYCDTGTEADIELVWPKQEFETCLGFTVVTGH